VNIALSNSRIIVTDVGIYLSIKMHSFVHYSPRDVHMIADKLNNAVIQFVCNHVDIPRTIMQFNAYFYIFKTYIILKHRFFFHSNFPL